MGQAQDEFESQAINADNESELKGEVLTLESGKKYNFFKKDMVLGNIGDTESRFADVCFDLIGDLKVFSESIMERQYVTHTIKYNNNKQYKIKIDKEVKDYNKVIEKQIKDINNEIKAESTTKGKSLLTELMDSLEKITYDDYFKMLATEEAIKNFFDFSSEKIEIAVYSKLNLSRSKGGFQQKELFRKRLEQKLKEISKNKSSIPGMGG